MADQNCSNLVLEGFSLNANLNAEVLAKIGLASISYLFTGSGAPLP
jgi:hypothetical protein